MPVQSLLSSPKFNMNSSMNFKADNSAIKSNNAKSTSFYTPKDAVKSFAIGTAIFTLFDVALKAISKKSFNWKETAKFAAICGAIQVPLDMTFRYFSHKNSH